jgi:hypothetical protein
MNIELAINPDFGSGNSGALFLETIKKRNVLDNQSKNNLRESNRLNKNEKN